jgi:hypothetical protein
LKQVASDIIIWGTGMYGKLAYEYYKDFCNIVCYVDNNENKWGQTLKGIKICEPDVLSNRNVRVIIAVNSGINKIKNALRTKYNIRSYVVWGITENVVEVTDKNIDFIIDCPTVIVKFGGGLGNQMFQYAFMKCLEYKGKNVNADVSFYNNPRLANFELTKVFLNIKINFCEKQKLKELKKLYLENEKQDVSKFMIYNEPNIYEVKEKKADLSLLDIDSGILIGLFQSCYFAESIRDILLDEFSFNVLKNHELEIIANKIISTNSVGIHIRRGDYLSESNQWIYGGICTCDYYSRAIKYMRNINKDILLVFFSNDINWVKKQYNMENAIYVGTDLFKDYHDWYDMYLMSICKHNIIANSTFSWWGAWLNQNKEKIVIAPSKWVNQCKYVDIYPKGWITL